MVFLREGIEMKQLIITKLFIFSKFFWSKVLQYLIIKVLYVSSIHTFAIIFIITTIILSVFLISFISKNLPEAKKINTKLAAVLLPPAVLCLNMLGLNLEAYSDLVAQLNYLLDLYDATINVVLSESQMDWHLQGYNVYAGVYHTMYIENCILEPCWGVHGRFTIEFKGAYDLEGLRAIRFSAENMLRYFITLSSFHDYLIDNSPILREVYNSSGSLTNSQEEFMTINELWSDKIHLVFV